MSVSNRKWKGNELPEGLQEAMQSFLWWKKAQGVSDTTIEDYQGHIRMFFKSYPEAFNNQTKLKISLLEYMAIPASPVHFNHKLIYLRAFINWGINEGIFQENPLVGFKRKKTDPRIVEIEPDTIKSLLALPDRTSFAGTRDYALILLSIDCGIRPKEAFALMLDDISLGNLSVHVRAKTAKTRLARTLYITPATAEAIKELIEVRHQAWGKEIPVFCTSDGLPMKKGVWAQRMLKYSNQLGQKIIPYSLRHFYALEFLRAGGNIFALQRSLGHSDLSMTKRYLALTERDMRHEHDLATPVNKILPPKHRVRKAIKAGIID